MPRLEPEPFHEPIGLSPEVHRKSRRWLMAVVAAVVVLGTGIFMLLRLGGFRG